MNSRYTRRIVLPILEQFRELRRNSIFDSLLQKIQNTSGETPNAPLPASVKLQAVGRLLGGERAAQELSLAELEAATGVNRSQLCRLETKPNSNPTIGTLDRIAAALGKQLVVAFVDADDQHETPDAADAAPT